MKDLLELLAYLLTTIAKLPGPGGARAIIADILLMKQQLLVEYAWYIHMEGARIFYVGKDQSCLVWPVRGKSHVLLKTGQSHYYDASGQLLNCAVTVDLPRILTH